MDRELGYHSWKKIRESEDIGSNSVPLEKSIRFCAPTSLSALLLGLGLEFTVSMEPSRPHI